MYASKLFVVRRQWLSFQAFYYYIQQDWLTCCGTNMGLKGLVRKVGAKIRWNPPPLLNRHSAQEFAYISNI